MTTPAVLPSPVRIFETLRAYQQTAALRTAIELDVFTAIGSGAATAAEIAAQCAASERGIRILCDTVVTDGFLVKQNGRYSCSPEAAVFLDRSSPACIASVSRFLCSPETIARSLSLTDCVRKGGTMESGQGSVEPDNPLWVLFAQAMGPLMAMPAQMMAEAIAGSGPLSVLDIAAGHGVFGVAIAKRNPEAQITAVDWAAVLEVAKENAEKAGVADRVRLLPGSAFEVDFGCGYDIVLITNFLHHFDPPACESFLRKAHAALKPGGKAITLEFCPNDDRVTPVMPARFALTMLLTTTRGDAYTFRELEDMFRNAGFASNEQRMLPSEQSVIISTK
ncbi:MAG: class I SAM-dependent methyltransferase [Acidobacteriota bacterium]|nr:class I SAM-dependent methyltransferase [Acidobacteriota bacterium]